MSETPPLLERRADSARELTLSPVDRMRVDAERERRRPVPETLADGDDVHAGVSFAVADEARRNEPRRKVVERDREGRIVAIVG